jgi:hypothetical protein
MASEDPTVANSNRVHRVSVVSEDWVADAETLAVTTYTFKKSSGEITDADIVINGTGPCLTFDEAVPEVCFDARAVLLHEVGHFLGLDHARHASGSIMYPTLLPGDESKRALATSDIEDLRTMYAGGSATANIALQSSELARSGCSAQASNAFTIWLGLLLMLRVALRRREAR